MHASGFEIPFLCLEKLSGIITKTRLVFLPFFKKYLASYYANFFKQSFLCCYVFILAINLNENSMKTKFFFIFCIFILAISVSIIACKKNNGTVPVQLLLTDNPTSYDEVNVHILDMKVKMNNDEGWTDLETKDTTVNLLDFQDGVTILIAEGDVPEGTLKEVRFVLGSDNNIVVGGIAHPLQTPSAEESGLKIKINKNLEESLNTLVLDFDAALSIKEENGNYKLDPVIRWKP